MLIRIEKSRLNEQLPAFLECLRVRVSVASKLTAEDTNGEAYKGNHGRNTAILIRPNRLHNLIKNFCDKGVDNLSDDDLKNLKKITDTFADKTVRIHRDSVLGHIAEEISTVLDHAEIFYDKKAKFNIFSGPGIRMMLNRTVDYYLAAEKQSAKDVGTQAPFSAQPSDKFRATSEDLREKFGKKPKSIPGEKKDPFADILEAGKNEHSHVREVPDKKPHRGRH